MWELGGVRTGSGCAIKRDCKQRILSCFPEGVRGSSTRRSTLQKGERLIRSRLKEAMDSVRAAARPPQEPVDGLLRLLQSGQGLGQEVGGGGTAR